MPKITKEWLASLDRPSMESVLSLGQYNCQAMLLFIDVLDLFAAVTDAKKTDKQRREAFWEYFVPYCNMWLSMVFVVHEGLEALHIEDAKLDKFQQQIDMGLLRRFRNATFHFQRHIRDPRHRAFYERGMLRDARQLYERQDFLIRKMARLTRHNPHISGYVL
jgi:hypothetical protein